MLAHSFVADVDRLALARLQRDAFGHLKHAVVGLAKEIDGHGTRTIVGQTQFDGLLFATLKSTERKHLEVHIETFAEAIWMVVGDGMLHADHRSFHPKAYITATVLGEHNYFLAKFTRSIAGIEGYLDTSCLSGSDGFF